LQLEHENAHWSILQHNAAKERQRVVPRVFSINVRFPGEEEMMRTRYLLLSVFMLVLLTMAQPAIATSGDCFWVITDVSTISGTDPDGTYWQFVRYYWGWLCTDGLLDDERLPGDWGGGGDDPDPEPDPAPQPPPGCSFTNCKNGCDKAYLEHAGVEVIGETIIHHFTSFECSVYCLEYSRMQWEDCHGGCFTDCTLP
jgi:hypothetical protein